MTLEIRRLDPTADHVLFEQSYQWLIDGPQWRRECEAVFGTLDRTKWLAQTYTQGRFDIGIFIDQHFAASVGLIVRGTSIYEVHFDAERGTPLEAVIDAGISIRDQMFDYGMQWCYTWIPHWNRPVLAVNKAIGFHPDNVSMLHGTCRGRLIEWVRYSLRNTNGR